MTAHISECIFVILSTTKALGSFGAHKFYLGQHGLGVVYVVFFWTLIRGLLGVIEGVFYLASSEARFERMHVAGGRPSQTLRSVQLLIGAAFLLVAVDTAAGVGGTLGRTGLEALACAAIGVGVLPPVRERVAKRHSLTAVGHRESVRTTRQRSEIETCTTCLGVVEDGVVRTFGTESVLFGLSLWFDAEGRNHYCRDCFGSGTDGDTEQDRAIAKAHA